MGRGKDVTQMLRSVNAQQHHESRSPKRFELGANEQASAAKPPADAAAADATADGEEEAGKSVVVDSRRQASLQDQSLRSGCYVCGKGSVDNGDIFVDMSNEGEATDFDGGSGFVVATMKIMA
jgi:hypothetical protein